MKMSTYNSVPGEPAFLANKRLANKSSSLQRSLSDCCYSFSNLVIIFACFIGLYFTVKFINDDPLYDYGEHLLTLRFYRQLVYIIVVFPLIVLVPLFNAASACFSAGSRPNEPSDSSGQPALIAKISYQVIVALLAFVGLIFVAPSIKYSSLVKQIDFEFKRHMKYRYDKDFSYLFLDRIQQEYDCCDDDWYRANYNDKIPTTCYDDPNLSQLFQQTCPEAIGSIVSTRCCIIAACLVVILVGLAILIALDVLKLLVAQETYDVGAREQHLIASATSNGNGNTGPSNRSPSPVGQISGASRARNNIEDGDDDDDDDGGFRGRIMARPQQADQNRLGSEERRRERPLLVSGRSTPLAEPEPDPEVDRADFDFYNSRLAGPQSAAQSPPAILTKANYMSRPAGSRPKSPVFVSAVSRSTSPVADWSVGSSPAPPRGVLKKTSSLSRSIDRDSLIGRGSANADDDEQAEFEAYQQQQQQQQLQNQRPLFNVRFAE